MLAFPVMFNTGGASDFLLKIKFVYRFFSIYSSLLHDFYMFHRKKLKYLARVILDNFQTDIIVILKFCSKREGRQPPTQLLNLNLPISGSARPHTTSEHPPNSLQEMSFQL